MLTVTVLLVFAAFILTIGAALNRAPLWIPVLLLTLAHLLAILPR